MVTAEPWGVPAVTRFDGLETGWFRGSQVGEGEPWFSLGAGLPPVSVDGRTAWGVSFRLTADNEEHGAGAGQ